MPYPIACLPDSAETMRPRNVNQAAEPSFIIGADGVDRQDLLRAIRENASRRLPVPHAAAALGRAHMDEERQNLVNALRELKRAMRDYGVVETRRPGWLGAIELFVKRSVRKLFLRHLLQQHRVHLKLTKFLGRVITYLEVYDESLRTNLDHCEHGREVSTSGAEKVPLPASR
jgi:hypothetical protein